MDETTGGTMTPPIGHDDEFAPVIPLRRRDAPGHEPIVNGTPDEQARGIWDPDAAPTDLPTRPSVWDQPAATELPLRSTAEDIQGPAAPTTAPTRRFRRFPHARWTLAAMPLAVAALMAVFVIAPGGGPTHPHATRTHTTADAHTPEDRQIHTTVTSAGSGHGAAARPKARAGRSTKRHTTATRATDPATRAKQQPSTDGPKLPMRRGAHRRESPSHATQSTQTTAGPPTTIGTSTATTVSPPTTVASSVAPPSTTLTAPPASSGLPGSAASQCVPGELGC